MNGLPLHPLLVHAVIALVPITSFAVILHALWPMARRRLGVLTPLAGLATVVAVPITVLAGRNLLSKVGPIPAAERHAALGEMMLPFAIALFLIAVLEWIWFGWRDRMKVSYTARTVVTAAVGVVAIGIAVGSLILLVLIGDAGARAVWGA